MYMCIHVCTCMVNVYRQWRTHAWLCPMPLSADRHDSKLLRVCGWLPACAVTPTRCLTPATIIGGNQSSMFNIYASSNALNGIVDGGGNGAVTGSATYNWFYFKLDTVYTE